MKLEVANVETEAVPAVKCLVCGTLHDATGTSFVTFVGNFNVGLDGGVIGNNLDADGRVVRVTAVCRTKECLLRALSPAEIPGLSCSR